MAWVCRQLPMRCFMKTIFLLVMAATVISSVSFANDFPKAMLEKKDGKLAEIAWEALKASGAQEKLYDESKFSGITYIIIQDSGSTLSICKRHYGILGYSYSCEISHTYNK